MPHFSNTNLEIGMYVVAGVVLLVIGYQLGRWIGQFQSSRAISQKEQELFTTQKGFKQLYEQELAAARATSAQFEEQVKALTARVEEYRRKAAGFGGLFNSGGKKADAMYALLLENESLEEALHSQNEKLKQERTDSLKETMRSTGYRRVLMSQLLNDERIKSYVAEIISDERRLPAPEHAGADSSSKQ